MSYLTLILIVTLFGIFVSPFPQDVACALLGIALVFKLGNIY